MRLPFRHTGRLAVTHGNRMEPPVPQKGEVADWPSAPPVASENPDHDNDCDNRAREDDEELKDLRNVHNYVDIDSNAPKKGEREVLDAPMELPLQSLNGF